jgi:hypothetical protein
MEAQREIAEAGAAAAEAENASARSTSALLEGLAEDRSVERMSVGGLLDALEDRAFGLALLILALPCAIPFLYGIPQVVAVPMLLIAAQIAAGRHTLWLPQKVRAREFSAESFRSMVARGVPWIRRLESIARPRLTALVGGAGERVFGLFLVAFAATILIPLPGTNTWPGIAVAIVALGFIERDGLMATAGAILGTLWIALLATLGVSGLLALKTWLTGLFA